MGSITCRVASGVARSRASLGTTRESRTDWGGCAPRWSRAWATYQNASLQTTPMSSCWWPTTTGPTSRRRTASAVCSAMNQAVWSGSASWTSLHQAILDQTQAEWERFLAEGRQEGTYQLRDAAGRRGRGSLSSTGPPSGPGIHVSRLWPCDPAMPRGSDHWRANHPLIEVGEPLPGAPVTRMGEVMRRCSSLRCPATPVR